jgi:hypothetical protein
MRVPVSLHPHQHLLLFLPLNMNILTGVRGNLSVVLICISFIAKEVEHFFMYLLAILLLSLRIHCLMMCPFLHWDVEFFEFFVDSGY